MSGRPALQPPVSDFVGRDSPDRMGCLCRDRTASWLLVQLCAHSREPGVIRLSSQPVQSNCPIRLADVPTASSRNRGRSSDKSHIPHKGREDYLMVAVPLARFHWSSWLSNPP